MDEKLEELLKDAQSQYDWFNDYLKNGDSIGKSIEYYRGSRDAYGYMISAIQTAINS